MVLIDTILRNGTESNTETRATSAFDCRQLVCPCSVMFNSSKPFISDKWYYIFVDNTPNGKFITGKIKRGQFQFAWLSFSYEPHVPDLLIHSEWKFSQATVVLQY